MSPKKSTPATKAAARKAAAKTTTARKSAARKSAAKKSARRRAPGTTARAAPAGAPEAFRVRVRMYRQGLGDCFLVSFPRQGRDPFHLLIDCGVLQGDAASMRRIVEHLRDTVRGGRTEGKARLDVVVATHEHKDHLSGFNQARALFNDDFDFGAVWLGWTENLTQPEIEKIKETRRKAAATLRAALDSPAASAAPGAFDGVAALLAFSSDDDTTGSGKIADALEYLKLRGRDSGGLRYLEPGTGPLALDGVDGVRVYVLGPPRDPVLLKGSEVTEQLKRDGVVYHLASTGEAGMDALAAALSSDAAAAGSGADRWYPFAAEHRVAPTTPDPLNAGAPKANPYFQGIQDFLARTYDDPAQRWRRIDDAWLSAFDQLALDLDSDTNNTSLVLAFEFTDTQEVLLFVGDAQVGNWRSWAGLSFDVPGRDAPMPAHDLLRRTVFYKVGHHASHNATLKKGGLELMLRDDLVAFIPLDRATAAGQGRKDPATGKPRGWEMPAPALYRALLEKAAHRVVISDRTEPLSPEAQAAGVVADDVCIDYYLR